MEAGDAFQEVEDILRRHATLEAASADLQVRLGRCAPGHRATVLHS